MRARALLLTAALSALVAACGGDDDDDGSSEALTAADAQAIVDDAVFSEADLGEGWALTGTEPASDGERDEDDPFGQCMATDIDQRLEAEELAESETRKFEKAGDLAPSELEISAGAIEDAALFGEFHDALRSDTFERCLVEAIEEEIAGEDTAGLEIAFGAVDLGDDDVEGADVTHVHLPITMSAEGLNAEARVDFVFVTRGQVGSFFFSFGFGDSISDTDVDRWTGLVAERLAE